MRQGQAPQRNHMRTQLMLGVAFAATLLFVSAGCNKGGSSSSGSAEVEVAVFQGGYGIDFFEQAARDYEAAHPGAKVKVWGNPRVWEQLRPRFVAGSPPDVTWPGWGMDYWAMVYDGQLLALDEALSQPPAEGEGTWRDTFEPELLKLGQYEGKQYMLPYHYNMNGWWYDPNVFEKNGWTPPATFEELLALAEKIKAKGIAPLTFQGKYPYYMISGFLFPWAISAGGIEALDAAQSLEPGAWNSPAFLKAAEMIAMLRDRGLFQNGAIGMSHTESQTEFLQGRAAMIPCGTWLHSEMREVMPPNAKMRFMLPPPLKDGHDPTNINIGIEPWVIPIKGKHSKDGIEFFRFMTSLTNAKKFVEQKGTLMSIRGSDQANLPEHLIEPAKAFANSEAIWSVEYRLWYPTLGKETENAMASLLSGEITPQQFVNRCEAEAERVRNDATVPKRKINR